METKETTTLIKNVNIFNGTSDKLIAGQDVVLVGNKIDKLIDAGGEEASFDEVIDGNGGVLMPGLIDAHTHLAICANIPKMMSEYTWDYIGPLMGAEAERYLMRGFTTVRDVGGPTLGLKKLIDEELIRGPRIFSSGMGISQTAGHGDWRFMNSKSSYFTGERNFWTDMNFFYLADGVAEVQKAVREALARQAAQIKVCVGGGVTSLVDPLEAVQYTPEELKAANDEATRYGTYVCVHVHTDEGIKAALDAGVKSIEHGMLIKEDTMKRLVDEDAWLCPQAFIVMQPIEGNPVFANPIQKAKMQKAQEGAVNEFKWAKQYGAKVAWGTDMFGDRSAFDNTLREFEFRAQFYANAEQLQQVTGNNGKLLELSNFKHPYPGAKLGVIEPDAYADLLIVDGDPLADINVMLDYENNFKLIMKDGKVYKNTL
jgi:imidazolonepropionase-like amidohydrolase